MICEREMAGRAFVIFGWLCVPFLVWDWLRHHP